LLKKDGAQFLEASKSRFQGKNSSGYLTKRPLSFNISRIDCPYTASTCDVMYVSTVPPFIYYDGENLKYYLTTPTPQFFLHRRAALTTYSKGPSLLIRGRDG
jgi:hypothetical protein